MRRRDIFALGTLALAGAVATSASASEDAASEGTPSLNIAGVGLPIISGGRIRNYVFVTIRLYLGGGQTPETMRAKDPYFRDALVRAAHRTPFVVADDWTRVNETAISAMLMSAAPAISGAGSVVRADVVTQTPRRRTGVRQG